MSINGRRMWTPPTKGPMGYKRMKLYLTFFKQHSKEKTREKPDFSTNDKI